MAESAETSLEKIIRINKSVPELLVKDNATLKYVSMFYSLKFLYVGGVVKNMTGRYGEISSTLGVSETNLRNKLKKLVGMGLVEWRGRDVLFLGFDRIVSKMKLETRKSYRISYRNPKQLETVMKALALNSNYEKQQHKITKRIVREELKRYGKIEAKSIRNKVKRHIRKNIRHYAVKYQQRVSSKSSDHFSNPKVNTDVSISRNGLAIMVGRKSKSSGSRLMGKFTRLGLVETDSKRFERVSVKTSKAAIRHLALGSSYFVFKDCLYRRHANLVTLNKFFA